MSDDDHIEASKAPLLDHLIELRRRLLWSLFAILVAFIGCYIVSEQIYNFLVQPLADALKGHPEHQMIYTQLYEGFLTRVKVALYAALMLSFPIIASQIWMFVAPGLYRHERVAFLPFLLATPILFLCGAAMAYYIVFPAAWHFFLGFEVTDPKGLKIVLQPRVSEYLSLVMTMIFAFGLCFELPVLLVLLGRVGIVSSKMLVDARRYALVGIFIVAAVVTPPDAFSQIALGVPIYLLYEISILCIRMVEKKRDAKNGENSDDMADD